MRIAFLILVPLAVLAIALTGTHILLERLFILIVLVILLCYGFTRFWLSGLKGRVNNPGEHYLPGQTFQIDASVENTSRWPRSFLNLQIKTGNRDQERKVMIDLPSGASCSWQEQISYPRRGLYQVGPLVVEASDPFGIFRLRRTLDKGKQIIICPETQELPNFQAESGPLRNRFMSQEAGAFSGIREYVPGDSLSRIHWRSTAHTGKLIVKEFEIDRSERIWVLPDLNRDFIAGSGEETTTEYIMTIAASIVKKYADRGRPVGMIAQNTAYHYYPARSGYLNMWRIMEALAVIKTDGRIPMPRLVYKTREQLTGNSVAILITASPNDDIADSIIGAAKLGLRPIVILVDGSTFGGRGSPQKTQRRLAAQSIPAYLVRQGHSLGDELNNRTANISVSSGAVIHDLAA
jgi:uncharacterized protein (DUF58 family)